MTVISTTANKSIIRRFVTSFTNRRCLSVNELIFAGRYPSIDSMHSNLSAIMQTASCKTNRVSGRTWMLFAILSLGLTVFEPRAVAQANPNPPTKLTYQGFLTDQNGVPIGSSSPTNKTIVFRIYDALTGGNKLWTAQQTVTVDKGHFSVLLGEGSAYNNESFNADLTATFTSSNPSDRFLELTVDGTTITPRQQFFPSPYAMLSRKAMELVGGSSIAGGITVGGTVNVTGAATFTGGLSVSGTSAFNSAVTISGQNTLEFGAGVSGKEGNAGKIGYQVFTSDSLDIVGAGTSGSNRKVRVFSEGGTTIGGPLTVSGTISGYGAIPVGGIIMWSGPLGNIPDGWALCDGSISNGQTTPDLRSRFIVGASNGSGPSGLTTYAKGDTGGEEKHKLTIAEMPSHNHTFKDNYFAENGGINNGFLGSGNSDTDNHLYSTPNTTDTAGSDQPHENRPPYYALAFIMRVK